jgi:hypothetical protein
MSREEYADGIVRWLDHGRGRADAPDDFRD